MWCCSVDTRSKRLKLWINSLDIFDTVLGSHLQSISCLSVMGSIQWPLLRLDVFGTLSADGQSFDKAAIKGNGSSIGGLGGGSGGTILIFLQELRLLTQSSSLSVAGGKGGPLGGGGGGGGRVHFHWSKIDVGDEYVPVASISGSINSR